MRHRKVSRRLTYLERNDKFFIFPRDVDNYSEVVTHIPATKRLVDNDVMNVDSRDESSGNEE